MDNCHRLNSFSCSIFLHIFSFGAAFKMHWLFQQTTLPTDYPSAQLNQSKTWQKLHSTQHIFLPIVFLLRWPLFPLLPPYVFAAAVMATRLMMGMMAGTHSGGEGGVVGRGSQRQRQQWHWWCCEVGPRFWLYCGGGGNGEVTPPLELSHHSRHAQGRHTWCGINNWPQTCW